MSQSPKTNLGKRQSQELTDDEVVFVSFKKRATQATTQATTQETTQETAQETQGTFREYQPGEQYLKFYSGAAAPYHNLSNFAEISNGILVHGNQYPSAEHAFQAQRFPAEMADRLQVSGELGNADTGFRAIYSRRTDNPEKKQQYWMGNKKNIGILAKMAANQWKPHQHPGFESSYELWEPILLAKFRQEPFKGLLLGTGNTYLVEFSRSAKATVQEKGEQAVYWAALVDQDEQRMYGQNIMGKYLMKIRDILQAENA